MFRRIVALVAISTVLFTSNVYADWTVSDIRQVSSSYEGVVYLVRRAMNDPRLQTTDGRAFTVEERQAIVDTVVYDSADKAIIKELRRIRRALNDIAQKLDGLAN